MANRRLSLDIILTAYDRMTRVVREATERSSATLKRFSDANSKRAASFAQVGTGAATMAAASAAVMAGPLMAYAELEDASTRLRSAMMRDGGVMDKNFERVNQLAIELGNKLPGTTADFQEMMLSLTRQGIASETILNGVGKSAAYLAVQLRLPYDEAAKMAAKLKEATGIADKDFMAFMDTIARTNQMGVDSGEMQYAFSRSAGALKTLNLQGLEASKSLSTMYAILIKAGVSGETAGTGMTAVFRGLYDSDKMAKFNAEASKLGLAFKFQDSKGNFLGIENMMAQFDKMKGLQTDKQMNLINTLTGGGADAGFVSILANKGVAGYNDMVQKMAQQATLQKKVDEQLKTLKATWESSTGTFQNTMAAFFATIAPDVQRLAAGFGRLAEKLGNFTKAHPQLSRVIALTIVGFGAIMAVTSGVAFAFSGIFKVMSIYGTVAGGVVKFAPMITAGIGKLGTMFTVVGGIIGKALGFIGNAFMVAGRFLMANPIILIITAIAVAAFLIYKYWDQIAPFVMNVWNKVTGYVKAAWVWIKSMIKAGLLFVWDLFTKYHPIGIIIKHWDQIVAFFGKVWDKIKTVFSLALRKVWDLFTTYHPIGIIIKNWDEIMAFIKTIPARMNAAGQKIVDMLIAGIKSRAHAAVDALKDVVAKMREYLPFSPAKKGAFRDLHRVKIIETIAQAVQPKPLVRAMQAVAVAGMVAITPTAGAAKAAVSSPSASVSSKGGGGSIVINYNPTITIGSAGAESKEDFRKMLAAHKDELARMVAEVNSRKERRSFN